MLSAQESDDLFEQRTETNDSLQAIGTSLMNHIGDVMEMVQDKRALHEKELDEETLVTIEAQVKALAKELPLQAHKHLVGVSLTKRERSLSMQGRKDQTDESDHPFYRAAE